MNELIKKIRNELPEEAVTWDDLESIQDATDKGDEALAKAIAEECAKIAERHDPKAAVEIRLRFGLRGI